MKEKIQAFLIIKVFQLKKLQIKMILFLIFL